MGLLTVFKAQKARKAHQEGRTEEAMKLYQEVMDEGNKDPAVFLPYSVLLIRNGRYRIRKRLTRREWLTQDVARSLTAYAIGKVHLRTQYLQARNV